MSGRSFGIMGHGLSISVSATASSVGSTSLVMTGGNALHIANTSATLYVSVRWGVGAQTAVLGTDLTIPPMGWVVVDVPPTTTAVAAIGSAAGPTAVVFTPVRQIA